MAKFFYFAERNPKLSAQAFPARWRQHCALAMTMRSWDNKLLYVQANALPPIAGIGIGPSYDGFCYGLTESVGLLRPTTPQDKADEQALLTDELVTFEGPIPPRVMLFEEDILLVGGFGIVACLAFHDLDMAKAVGKSFAALPGLERVIVNRVKPGTGQAVAAADFAAVVEICATNEKRLLAALRSETVAPLRYAAVIMLAKETILWDRRDGRTMA